MAASDPAKCSSLDNSPNSNPCTNQISPSNHVPPQSNKAGIPGKPSAIPRITLQRCQYIQWLLSKEPPSFQDFFKLLIALVPEKDPRRNGCTCNIGPQAPESHNQPEFNHNTSHFAIEVLLTSYHRQWIYGLARKHPIFQILTDSIPSDKPSAPVSMKVYLPFGQDFTVKRCKATPIVDNSITSRNLETSLSSQTAPSLASLVRISLAYEPISSRNDMSLTSQEQVVVRFIHASLILLKNIVGSRRHLERFATRYRNRLLDHTLNSLQSLAKQSSDRFTSETALFEDFAQKFASFDRGEEPNVETSTENEAGPLSSAQPPEFTKGSLCLPHEQLARSNQSSSKYEEKLTEGRFSNKGVIKILNHSNDGSSGTAQGDLSFLDIIRLVFLYLAFRIYVAIRFWPTLFKKIVIPQFHTFISKIMAIYSGPHLSTAASKPTDGVRLPRAELNSKFSVRTISPLLKGTTSIMKVPDDVGCSAFPPKMARKVSWNDESGPWDSDEVSGRFSDGEAKRQLSHIHHKNSKIMPKSPKPQATFALTQKKKRVARPTIEQFKLADGVPRECPPASPLSSSIPTSSSSSSKDEDQMSEEETHSIIEHINKGNLTQILISSPPKTLV